MTTDLRQRLEQEPYRFEFFQAIRILRWLAETLPKSSHHAGRKPLGFDAAPSEEIIRCRSHLSHSFPQGSISSFRWRDDRPNTPPEMVTAFLGLTGPNGVLPRHYTQLLIDRVRDKDTTLRDFFDLFNHRMISHFYRAWAKYRFPIAYEDSKFPSNERREPDKFTSSLFAFVGLRTKSLRDRLEVPDAAFLYYAGHFAHRPRNAVSMAGMISDFFRVQAEVEQFVGQWLYLDISDQSSLQAGGPLSNPNNCLGANVVVGQRVWGVENKLRLRLGPLRYAQFCQYLPGGDKLQQLGQFARMYAGPEFDFDVNLMLHKEDVPMCQLGSGPSEARLGWNTWLHNRPFEEHAVDPMFVVHGDPSKN